METSISQVLPAKIFNNIPHEQTSILNNPIVIYLSLIYSLEDFWIVVVVLAGSNNRVEGYSIDTATSN